MESQAQTISAILAEVLEKHGVGEAVCSPGSRCIPLLRAFHHSAAIHDRMVIDERSAAFVALGMSLASGRPVALACTSGTAVLNYAPAVAEAFYQAVPLIVVSADRPEEWIDQDDSQTIRQPGVLDNIVKKSYDIADTDLLRKDGEWYAARVFNDAMCTALSRRRGPVHINVRINPPFTDGCDGRITPMTVPVKIVKQMTATESVAPEMMAQLARRAVNAKILVVAGFMPPREELNRVLAKLLGFGNVALIAETISNLYVGYGEGDCISAVDALIRSGRLEYPDIVITIGGAIVSRMLKEFIRSGSATSGKSAPEHWSVGYNHTTVDCFRLMNVRADCDPVIFFREFIAAMVRCLRTELHLSGDCAGYGARVRQAQRSIAALLDKRVEEGGWTEAMAVKTLMEELPRRDNLCISNGGSIRYVQLLTRRMNHAQYCNRGVSGIEGSTSTAVGVALSYGPTWLLTGDMSLCHDLGGLYAAHSQKQLPTLRIVVISNQGGGIFRFIEAARDLDIREEMLCVDMKQDLRGIAEAFGFRYFEADEREGMRSALEMMKDMEGLSLLNVKVDGVKSARFLRESLLSPDLQTEVEI